MYIAIIFEAGAEGVEGEVVFGEDHEGLKTMVQNAVDNAADEEFEYEWNGETYYPTGDPQYGTFPWAKVYSAYEYEKVSFSEYA